MKSSGIFTLAKLLFLFRVLLAPVFWLWSWFARNTKLGRWLALRADVWFARFNNLNKFKQKFIIGVSVGLLSYLCFTVGSQQHFKPIIDLKNLVFDSTLIVFTEFVNKEDIKLKPIFIAFDEESYQNTSWSTTADKAIAFNHNILQLVDTAYDKGSRHVFVDFVLHNDEHQQQKQLAMLNKLRDKYKNNKEPLHLYAVIASQPDPCMPSISYHSQIENSIWQKVPLQTNHFFIHPVSPTIYESEDKVIRNWQLFTTNQQIMTNNQTQKTAQWVFLPSPQLAYHVVSSIEKQYDTKARLNKLSNLPWLQNFEPDNNKRTDKVSRAAFIEAHYQRLLELTNSKQLQSYCSKTSDICIAPNYIARDADLAKKEKDKHELLAQLAYKNSEVCKNKIKGFVDKFQTNRTQQEAMENRIIYSMKAWYDSRRPEKEANYTLYTPTELFNPNARVQSDTWDNQLVAIGATYEDSRDINYLTPIGSMPGALVNLNAIVSFDTFGAIGLLQPLQKFFLNLVIIFIVALLFARFRLFTANVFIFLALAVLLVRIHPWLFANGIWIEFGLPIFVMNIISFVLEKRADMQKLDSRSDKNH